MAVWHVLVCGWVLVLEGRGGAGVMGWGGGVDFIY